MIAVIGGGWAGCAAAVEVASAGLDVELHEAASVLGGRARAVSRAGLSLDNGEHLLLRAYRDTRALAARIHDPGVASPWIERPLAIDAFAASQRDAVTLRVGHLPAPLGLLGALLCAGGLTLRDRFATLRWFASLRRTDFRCDASATVADILHALPSRARDGLFVPLCVASLNTPAASASAQVFLNVLRDTFDGDAGACDTVTPRGGLADAIPDVAERWLRARGHAVHRSSRVRVATAGDRVQLAGRAGLRAADAIIVAVGPHQLAAAFDAELVTRDPAVASALRAVSTFEWQPIVTVYLGYAGAVTVPRALVRLDDAPGQWLFERPDILARAAPSATRPAFATLLSVVISAHGPHEALDHPSLTAAVDAQLRRLRPSLPALCWSQVIAERRATYSCVPGLSPPRCGLLTGRVYIGGDYTYPALPATLESAVRSGICAARAVIDAQRP